jgi:3-hydroxybutyrate dehydrogenase
MLGILVTGAASGIGAGLARELARAGHHVIVSDLRVADCREVAEQIRAVGGSAEALELDVTSDASVGAAFESLSRPIDVLVNDAGLQHVSPIETFPIDRWRYLVDVMLVAPFVLTRAVLPGMRARGWGRIINIGSIHSLVASPNKSAYVAAKHGLLGLTRATALEAGPHGITVNAICPSFARTRLVERQIAELAETEGLAPDEVIERVMLEPAAVRRLVEPEEVARYAAFLCSDDAASITGSAQVIDGGWTAR